jgi:hypothetical protein
VFRVFELEGGEYLVAAGLRGMDAEVGRLTADDIDVGIRDLQQRRANPSAPVAAAPPSAPSYGFAPVYFPGAHDLAAATPVAVATGEERTGVDMIIRLSPTVAIDGIVTAPDGSVPELILSLEPEVAGPLPDFMSAGPSLSVPAGPDGRFQYIGVSPGTYVVTARTVPAGRGARPPADATTAMPAPTLWAATTITVSGADVSGVALSLRPAMRVSGRVAFVATTLEPADVSAVRINLRALGVEGGYSVNSGALRGRIPVEAVSPGADATFQLRGVLPGTYQIGANLPGAKGRWLRSAMSAGRDLLDEPLEVTSGSGDIGGVVLTFTDRHTQLSGTLQTTAGTPATEYFIVIFTADRSLWRAGQRRLRTTRPATDGVFSIRDLPPGDYFVAALTDLDPAWQTAAFLEPLIAASVKITIGDGASVRQDLRLAQ